jgi:hypothetical protein
MNNVGCNTQVHGSNAMNFSVYISLSQTSKNTMSFLVSLIFSLQQNQRRRGQNRFSLEAGGWGGGGWCTNNVYKCK